MNYKTIVFFSAFCSITPLPLKAASKPQATRQAGLKPTSEFSSTKLAQSKCLSSGEGRASYLCSGFGGYQVELEIFANRSGINLRYEGKSVNLLDQTFEVCPGENPEKANDVVQWRGYRKGPTFIPYAVIYRLYTTNPQSPKNRFNTLVVIKLDGQNSRVIGQVSGSRGDGNTAAETMADQMCAPDSEEAIAGSSKALPEEKVTTEESSPTQARPEVLRGEEGSVLKFPNGQKFPLESTRGVLGPSSNPSSQVPFVGPGGWLVAINEAPATKTSLVHLYVRDKTGRYSEVKKAHEKILKMVSYPDSPKNPEFIRVEEILDAWEGKLRLSLQLQESRTGKLTEGLIVVGRTGSIESGYRGE